MLTVIDIQNKEFKKNKIGGYNTEEVNEYLERIVQSYQEVINENQNLKEKIKSLNESIQYYRTMESTIQNVLVLADKTAQDTKAAAYEKAEQMKDEAQEKIENMTRVAQSRINRIIEQGKEETYELSEKLEDAKRQYKSYKSQFKQLLQSQMDFMNEGDSKMSAYQEDLTKAFAKILEEANVRKSLEEVTAEEKDKEPVKSEKQHNEAVDFSMDMLEDEENFDKKEKEEMSSLESKQQDLSL